MVLIDKFRTKDASEVCFGGPARVRDDMDGRGGGFARILAGVRKVSEGQGNKKDEQKL